MNQQQPYAPHPGQHYVQAGEQAITSEERTLAYISHLGSLAGILLSAGYLSWLPALIIYLMKKDSSPFVRKAAAGALNFALNLLLWCVVAGVLLGVGFGFAFFVLPVLLIVVASIMFLAIFVAGIVFPIMAALAVNRNESYTYPLTINFIK